MAAWSSSGYLMTRTHEPKLSVIAAIQPGGSKLIIGNSQQPRSVLGERACQVVYQMPLTGSGANLRTVAR